MPNPTPAARYIALKRFPLPEGGFVESGAEVPNVDTWRRVEPWVKAGWLRLALPGELDAAPAAAEEPAEALAPDAEPSEALAALEGVLKAVVEDSSSHKVADILAAAKAAGIPEPDPVPRLKTALAAHLAEVAGITL